MGQHHNKHLPGESADYREKRDALLTAEIALRTHIEEVNALRQQLPLGGKVNTDYVFEEETSDGLKQVCLSELFDNGNSLIVYGFMFGATWDKPCPSCTSVTDATNGQAEHVRAKTNIVVVARAPAKKLRALAIQRGWNNIRFLSSANNSFSEDYFAEDNGSPDPMLMVFQRKGAEVHHFWSSETFFVARDGHPRHVDAIWPLWNLLDVTPEGRENFMPSLDYDKP